MRLLICLILGLLLGIGTTQAAEPVQIASEHDLPGARQPQVAVDPLGRVFIAFGVEDAIHCAISNDGGKTFARPIKVGEAGVMALGMRRGPRVAATDKAVVVTAVCGQVGGGKDGDILAWRSTDAGKTWQGPRKINAVEGSAREGLQGLAAGPSGELCCVWLDLRQKKSQVYGAISKDHGATWQTDRLIYESPEGSVCQCCQPSVAFDPKGGLHVLWRNLLQGERNMYLLSSTDGGTTFGPAQKLGQGSWTLQRCPMDGGALAGDGQGPVQTIWMRNQEIFRSGTDPAETSLGRGEQGWIAHGPDGFYLVWLRSRPGALMALVPDASRPTQLVERANDPVVAAPLVGRGPVIAAWEEGQGAQRLIRALVLRQGAK